MCYVVLHNLREEHVVVRGRLEQRLLSEKFDYFTRSVNDAPIHRKGLERLPTSVPRNVGFKSPSLLFVSQRT